MKEWRSIKRLSKLRGKLTVLYGSIFFIRDHFLTIFALGLIAAFGRVIQLGCFGEIPSWVNVGTEVAVETSRILIFLFVLGVANIKSGARLLKRFFANRFTLKASWAIAKRKIRTQWVQISLSFAGFLIIAAGINFLIDTLAYETCLLLTLKSDGILVDTSSEWTVLLFFKNILVIPFTIVFETLLLLWITREQPLNSTQ